MRVLLQCGGWDLRNEGFWGGEVLGGSLPLASEGIDYDYDYEHAHEHDGERGGSFAFGFGRGSITSYDYDDDYGVEPERSLQ